MSLESGMYNIRCLANNNTVNRFHIEDRSLMPKRILPLKSDQDEGMRPWVILKCGDNTYKMKALGSPVGENDGLLFAFLIGEEQGREWKIEACPQMGENCFVIMRPDEPVGWCVPELEEDRVQIAVRPLISTRSFPPKYPPNEVFVITRVME